MAPAGKGKEILAVLDTAIAGCVDASLLQLSGVQVGRLLDHLRSQWLSSSNGVSLGTANGVPQVS